MLFGVWNFVNTSYIHVSNDTWIGSVSCLLQISCVKSRISSCFVLVHIYTINLTALTLLKEMTKSKLPVMFMNCRNSCFAALKLNVLSFPFKIACVSSAISYKHTKYSTEKESHCRS